jgi:hypothetical protein
MCGSKRGEATGDWRKLHNEKLHELYFSRSIIWETRARLMRLSMHIARIGKPKAKRLLEICRHALDGTLKMQLGMRV